MPRPSIPLLHPRRRPATTLLPSRSRPASSSLRTVHHRAAPSPCIHNRTLSAQPRRPQLLQRAHQQHNRPTITQLHQHQTSSFHTTNPLAAPPQKRAKGRGKGKGPQVDPRIRLITYTLRHPILPRPLRLSRSRTLRHWTIARAWALFQRKQREEQELALQRRYMSMRNACEVLRLMGEDGLAVEEAGSRAERPAGARDVKAVRVEVPVKGAEGGTEVREVDVQAAARLQKQVGKLLRQAMTKEGNYAGVPIEYARARVDTPARDGWEDGWVKPAALRQ